MINQYSVNDMKKKPGEEERFRKCPEITIPDMVIGRNDAKEGFLAL